MYSPIQALSRPNVLSFGKATCIVRLQSVQTVPWDEVGQWHVSLPVSLGQMAGY